MKDIEYPDIWAETQEETWGHDDEHLFQIAAVELKRKGRRTEDSWGINENGACVVDGMSGLAAGDIAASVARRALLQALDASEGLSKAVELADSAVLNLGEQVIGQNVGASCAAFALSPCGDIEVAAFGDALGMVVGPDGILQKTEPHVRGGLLTDRLGKRNRGRRPEPSTLVWRPKRGEALVLASDGAWRYLVGDLGSFAHMPAAKLARCLIDRAYQAHTSDDATCIAITALSDPYND